MESKKFFFEVSAVMHVWERMQVCVDYESYWVMINFADFSYYSHLKRVLRQIRTTFPLKSSKILSVCTVTVCPRWLSLSCVRVMWFVCVRARSVTLMLSEICVQRRITSGMTENRFLCYWSPHRFLWHPTGSFFCSGIVMEFQQLCNFGNKFCWAHETTQANTRWKYRVGLIHVVSRAAHNAQLVHFDSAELISIVPDCVTAQYHGILVRTHRID